MTEVMKIVVEDKKHHWAYSPHSEGLKLARSNYSVRGGSDDNTESCLNYPLSLFINFFY